MDLVAGAQKVIVITEHIAKDGTPKIVQECSLPLTGQGVVDRIITNQAIFDVEETGLTLTKLAPGVTIEALRTATGAPFQVSAIPADDLICI